MSLEFSALIACGGLLLAASAIERANRQDPIDFESVSSNIHPNPKFAKKNFSQEVQKLLEDNNDKEILNLFPSEINPYTDLQDELKKKLDIETTFVSDPHHLKIDLSSFLEINSSFTCERELFKLLIENGIILSPGEADFDSPGIFKMSTPFVTSDLIKALISKLKKVKTIIDNKKRGKKRSADEKEKEKDEEDSQPLKK